MNKNSTLNLPVRKSPRHIRYPDHKNGSRKHSLIKKLAIQVLGCCFILLWAVAAKHSSSYSYKMTKGFLNSNVDLSKSQKILTSINSNPKITYIKSLASNIQSLKPIVQPTPSSNIKIKEGLPTFVDDNYGAGTIDYSSFREAPKENTEISTNIQPDTSKIKESTNKTVPHSTPINNKALKMIAPVKGAISSPFGKRVHPIKKTVESHKGVDIVANHGTQIKAAMSGEILEARTDPQYGKYVKIEHFGNIQTVYAHCSALLVKPGQKVSQGQVIGKVGATGKANGPHLHFEVIKNNVHVNPLTFVKISP